jgi:RNA polymerase sigma-70 factor (sigma-E family)
VSQGAEVRVTEPGLERFEDFVALRLPALYRFALTLTGSPHDAEDLVQEALVRTGLAWRRVRRKDAPESYVRMTMTRLMVNRWRRKWREDPVADVPDRATVDPALDRIADRSYLDSAVRDLPPRMRAVLVLRYLEGLTDEEVAAALGCTVGTVKSQASRGLAKLRPSLATQGDRHGRA